MDAAQLEALASAKQELPGYLEHHTAPQMVSPIELQDGSDSSDSDEGDSTCPRLDQIRRFLVGGPAFIKLHENLASFVDPLQIDAADDVEKYPKGEEMSRVPHATSADEPRNHDRCSSLIFNKRHFARNLVHSLATSPSWLLRFFRGPSPGGSTGNFTIQKVAQGYRRVEWRCVSRLYSFCLQTECLTTHPLLRFFTSSCLPYQERRLICL